MKNVHSIHSTFKFGYLYLQSPQHPRLGMNAVPIFWSQSRSPLNMTAGASLLGPPPKEAKEPHIVSNNNNHHNKCISAKGPALATGDPTKPGSPGRMSWPERSTLAR